MQLSMDGLFAKKPLILKGLIYIPLSLVLLFFSFKNFLSQAVLVREYGDTWMILNETRTWVTGGKYWREFGAAAPLLQLFFSPFTLLANKPAADLFYIIDWVAIISTISIFLKRIPTNLRPLWLIATSLMLLNFFPFSYALRAAKVELINAFIICLALHLHTRNRNVLSGLLIAIAASFKFVPGILLVYFLIKRQWDWVASFIFSGIFFLLVTVSVLGIEYHIEYVKFLSSGYIPWVFNQSLEASLHRLLAPFPPQPNNYYPNPPTGLLFKTIVLTFKASLFVYLLRMLRRGKSYHADSWKLEWEAGLCFLLVPYFVGFYRDYYIVLALPLFFGFIREWLNSKISWKTDQWGISSFLTGLFCVSFLGFYEVWGNGTIRERFVGYENYHAIVYLSIPFWGYCFLLLGWHLLYGAKKSFFLQQQSR